MSRKWITVIIVVLVAYFVWRKFGGRITSAITNVTK